jgi:hypothetical protein
MELRMQAVDQLLEAMAPALSAELERILQQLRQQIEDEFQSRLQSALRDAELATLHLAEVRLEEAVMEARESMRVQLTDSFAEQLNFTVQQTRDAMKAKSDEDMQAAFANWAGERSLLQAQLGQWHAYAEAQRQLSECGSQPEILARFLRLSDPFAGSLAIYVSKPDGLALWKSRGDGVFPELISPGTIDPEHYFKPAMVRNKMVAAVCAAQPCKVESLDFLMSCLERAIESFGLKLLTRTPRLPEPEAVSKADETTPDV